MANGRMMPALLTRTVRAEAGGCLDGARPVTLLADVEVDIGGGVADVLGHLLAEVVEHVAQHDLGALAGEDTGFGLTLPARCSGDDGHLAVESSHVDCLPL